MTAPTRQHIYIYDHPESKIKFLETSLQGQDWMASIVVPKIQTPDPKSYVDGLEKDLKSRGFITSRTEEADGTVSLHLHHLSNQTSVRDAIDELGLVKGTAFTLDHVGTPLAKVIHGATQYTFQMVKEPARLFSAIYVLGDLLYTTSGWMAKKSPTEQKESIWKPKNFLSSISGTFALAQSLIVIHYANNGGELNYSDLKNQFHQGERAGIDAMNVRGWTAPDMNKRALGPFDSLARKKPIEVGAWAQILGQGTLIGSSALQIAESMPALKATPRSEWVKTLTSKNPIKLVGNTLEEVKRDPNYANFLQHESAQQGLGSVINIMRSLVSISAWSVLMHPAKEGKVTASWSHPIDRIKQEYDYHPERMAGALNGVASLSGIAASHFKGNHAALAGEVTWLLGDVVMMFVHKDHYGGAAARKEVPLIDAATKLLQELPVAMSPSRQKSMVSDLALELAQKTVDEKTDSNRARTAPIGEEVAALKKDIENGVNANLSMMNTYFSRLTNACSILVERFEPEQREGFILALTRGVAAAPGIYATEAEIADAIRSRVDLNAGYGIVQPGMGTLARDIAQIVTSAPPISKAGIGVAIYDSVVPLMKTGPKDMLLLSKAVEDTCREQALASNAGETHASRVMQSASNIAFAKA